METKICKTCNQPKPLIDFVRNQKDSRTGKPYQFERKKCITCIGLRQKERLIERLGKEGAIKYHKMDKLRRNCRNIYKIKPDVAFTMLVSQNNQCKICARPIEFLQTKYDREACIDHDHSTGKVRGILCHWCNTGIGYFQDSPDLLEKSIAYLLRG